MCSLGQQVDLKGHSYGEVSRVIVLIEALLFGGLAAQGQQVGHLIRESGTFVDCIRLGRWSLETWLHSDGSTKPCTAPLTTLHLDYAGGLELANDIHYLRFYIGNETVSETDFSVKPCHITSDASSTSSSDASSTSSSGAASTSGSSAAAGPWCKSVSPEAYTQYTLPARAPIASSTGAYGAPALFLNIKVKLSKQTLRPHP